MKETLLALWVSISSSVMPVFNDYQRTVINHAKQLKSEVVMKLDKLVVKHHRIPLAQIKGYVISIELRPAPKTKSGSGEGSSNRPKGTTKNGEGGQ